ncbi:MAG: hypothetical protein HYW22_02230 [Candidatus Aenigmarchaeota archaeon]|nr:hypothetical protein [Candidatus Aenigmarchaeota archaeon]
MRTGIIIAVIAFMVLLPSVHATNVTLLHGYNGTRWVPLIISSDGSLQVYDNLTNAKNIYPKSDNSFDIGTSLLKWRDIFVSRNAYFATTSGLVGINTSSPISTLDISGNLSVSGSTNSSIDGSTFFVDATNNRVGIGTTAPNATLGVVGNIQLTGNVTPVAQPTSGNATQTTNNVETTNDVGTHPFMVIPSDGLPFIAYRDETNADLRVAKCGTTDCSSGNTFTTIDSTGDIGAVSNRRAITVAISTDGLPIISYYDVTNGKLKVAKCNNTTCSSSTISDIETTGAGSANYGAYITIAPDGLPVIAYYDNTNGNLKVAKCGTTDCSSGNILTTVESTNNVGFWPAIAIGADGLPIVSSYDLTNADLRVVKCGNIYCNASNVITAVDTTNDVGHHTSIAIGQDGLPVIAEYEDTASANKIRIVKCGNIACSSGNIITSVDTASTTGRQASLKIGPDGLPVASYSRSDGSFNDLRVLKCGNPSCTSGNTITDLDTGNVGEYSSLVIAPDGLPIIAYREENLDDLKIVKCAVPSCNSTSGGSYTFGSNLGTIGNFWNNIYSNQFWGKKFQIAAFDVAEQYETSDSSIGPGDVVSLAEGNATAIQKTQTQYSSQILGVVSTDPGIKLGDWNPENNPNIRLIALTGRVPVKTTNENGAINVGDFLTSSSKPGYAMKCPIDTDEKKNKCFGTTIGKALEPCNSNECKILVFVTLQ